MTPRLASMLAAHRRLVTGLLAALVSAVSFGSSGAFAKPLLAAGWSSGALVIMRVGGAAVLLMIPALIAMRGHWRYLKAELPRLLLYGALSGATVQVAYFNAVAVIDVAIALLMEYSGILMVVLFIWATTRKAPGRLTLLGMVTAVGGVLLMLNPAGGELDLGGVLWGLLAAVGIATFFLVSATPTRLPSIAFVTFGLTVAAVGLGIVSAVGILPFTTSTADAVMSFGAIPWWVGVGELAVIAAAAAYGFGFVAAQRLGATPAAFAGLVELLMGVVWAGLLLGEMPSGLQLAGGAVMVAGVAAVQFDRARQEQTGDSPGTAPAADPDGRDDPGQGRREDRFDDGVEPEPVAGG